MKLRASFSLSLLIAPQLLIGQILSGYVGENNSENVMSDVSVYGDIDGLLTKTTQKGFYSFDKGNNELIIFYSDGFKLKEISVRELEKNTTVILTELIESLDEVEIIATKEKIFSLQRLNPIEGTNIFAGKKNEVILVGQSMANLASNNSRQIYSQVAGLNIFQNDDAGIQLNIGGRGLDPNRTSNFNTRQNGYDISADVLGYPESYYTPPSEAIEEIQIVRGAASLQYGTQFGGLVNFRLKSAERNQDLNLIIRNTIGSNNLITNFTSLTGSNNKVSYYAFLNFKQGSGFRENSYFNSKNFYLNTVYQLDTKSKLSFDITYFNYLAKQAGGLNDDMFSENPFQSNRSRNWFNVDWLLYNIKYAKEFNSNKSFSLSLFGLNAKRNALGFRVNRVDQIDDNGPRDLIKGSFSNIGAELKYLSNYELFKRTSVFVFGSKLYLANNTSVQGPGSDGSDPDFRLYTNEFSNYLNQSNYQFPNMNLSLFGENIIELNKRLSITPGFRLEYIDTRSNGEYQRILTDAASNVILRETLYENRDNKRAFILLGTGLTFDINRDLEFYSNISQNYRSVTFADISIINPAYAIDPNISDENGFTFDLGIRGEIDKSISLDLSAFYLAYNDRIGFIQKIFDDGNIKAYRTNTGDARIFGLESIVDLNFKKILRLNSKAVFNYFFNFSAINSEYIRSEEAGIIGNRVEYAPKYNLKSGIKFGFKNLTSYLQYSYLSNQFSDSSNSINSNLSGVIGEIPRYSVLDLSVRYRVKKKMRLEAGINNLLNTTYFTRRATGYPGPGIIPAPPRNYYVTIEIKI